MLIRYLVPIFLCLASLPAHAGGSGTSAAIGRELRAAIDGPARTPAHVERDRYRHPFETLRFFGIRPDMTVIEILPGSGWYTEILAPYLHDRGRLIEATPPATGGDDFSSKMARRYRAKLSADPAAYGKVGFVPFEPPSRLDLGGAAPVDMIVTFRNLHDLIYANVHGTISDETALQFFSSAYRTLKPGGILGVVAHRAPDEMSEARSFKLGRLPQPYVVALAKRAGFHLAASSQINANPKDPRDMPVWNLPPVLAKGKDDRAKYEAIGEGDNMTLKFVKPGAD